MTRPCRYDRYEIVAAQLEGTGEFTVDVCEKPAEHQVLISRGGEGVNVSVEVEVCNDHEFQLFAATGWQRSIRFRPDAAATSPAADS